ncbi:MAG: Gfo/Idh/MocA family oxidoreductase, partial [Brachybacterium sp.]|nr:Gfo/Idh/MocA family oxidoreductase [Brachybacterium sp.]
MSTTVPSPVRIGILGGGGIATAHLNAYAAVSDRATVTAIADVDPEALARRAAEPGAPGYP